MLGIPKPSVLERIEMYSEVIQQIDDQIEKLHRVRAAFPYMEDSLYGHKQFRTPPYYRQFGIDIVFCFTAPLKQEDITRLNAIGLWISQNFIIRLYAFLEYHGIIPPEGKGRLKQDLDGFDEIEILRRLRKIFAHTSGRYKAGDSEEKMLYTRIVEFFSLQVEDPSRATD